MSNQHLLLVDVSGFVHRAYHVGGNQFRSDGLPTWAITGTLGMLWRLLGAAQADQPTHAACIFDHPSKTFRHKMFPAYKSNRPARDQELTVQLPFLRHAAETMGMTSIEAEGYEADDLLATLAKMAADAGWRVSLVSSDKDLLQTVVDGKVEVIDPMTRVRMLASNVLEKLGVHPHEVPDYQALVGDAVDNIPGIDGIGSKAAARLIRLFGTVEGVVAGATARPGYFTGGQRIRLKGALKELQLYRTLATLRTDVPLDISLDDLVLKPVLREHVDKILVTLEAKGRFDAIFAGEPKCARVVPPVTADEAYGWWNEELIVSGQPVPDEPQCGYFERRLVRGGPYVPARIWRDIEMDFFTGEQTGSEVLRCQVGTKPADAVIEWSRLAQRPISVQKYQFEMADRAWASEFAPNDPKARPDLAIDPRTAPLPVFQKPAKKRGRHEQSSNARHR